jgi:NADH-quinone oxidoreductase subunit F
LQEKAKRLKSKELIIKICTGTGGIAAGSELIMDTFNELLGSAGVDASVRKRCSTDKVGCMGLCTNDVLVEIIHGDKISVYEHVKPEMVERIVQEHIVGGNPVDEWLVDDNYHNFQNKQTKLVLANCGKINPEDIDSYIAVGGYSALRNVIKTLSPARAIDIIKNSGLRGRGGAGFPTGVKWEICSKVESDVRYIICNADEGDPGAFMDRSLLEGNPHSVIEGIIIGAYSIGSSKGYIYTRAEYTLTIERLEIAINQAKDRGFLGDNILDSGFGLDIEIFQGAGAFVCGESTALMRCIEGKRGMPRPTPPNSAHKGLWGKPSVLNNVETFANVPLIINRGPDWFKTMGTELSTGTKVFGLMGKINNTGIIEVPMGIPLRDIIFDIGGGIAGGKKFKALQTDGPSGVCITSDMIDINVDFESLASIGSTVGSGWMMVLDEDNCMVNMAKYFLQFTQEESCGKCIPCRIGTKRLLEILERITAGNGRENDIELLERLGSDIIYSSLCGLGKSAPNPVMSTIKHFRDEYEAHLEGRCPAKVCNALLTFTIVEDNCKGCGACRRACPGGAITGEKKKPHRIDQDLCIKCGACFDTCKFGSVFRE